MMQPPAPNTGSPPAAHPTKVKQAVSVSIGSSKRDASIETELLGQRLRLERRGTNGDVAAATRLIGELDGQVDAIGLGGLDLFFTVDGRRYYLRDGLRMARGAKKTPVVCGAGLKDSLERMAVEKLDGLLGWRGRRVLMVSAVDRFGMAEALDEHGANVLYGDLIFAFGLPLRVNRLRDMQRIARLLLPAVTKVPISWLYPTGKDQESTKSDSRAKHFEWAEVIAGDFHFIRRYAPPRLDGKVILTNTTTAADVEDMMSRGVAKLITTTPRFEGRSLPTNLLEAALVAAAGRFPLAQEDYRSLVQRAGLEPRIEG